MQNNLNEELYKIECEKFKNVIVKTVPDLIQFCRTNFKYHLFYLDVFRYSFGKKDASINVYIVSDNDLELDEEISLNDVIVNVKNISVENFKTDLYIRTNFVFSFTEGMYDFGEALNNEEEQNNFINEVLKKIKLEDLEEYAKHNLKEQFELFNNKNEIDDVVRISVSKFFEITEFYQTLKEVNPMFYNNQITFAILILLDSMRRKVCTQTLYNFLNHIPIFEIIQSDISSEVIELNYFEKIKKQAKETIEIVCS